MSKERQIYVRIPLGAAQVILHAAEQERSPNIPLNWLIERKAWEIYEKAVKKAEDREKRLEGQHEG